MPPATKAHQRAAGLQAYQPLGSRVYPPSSASWSATPSPYGSLGLDVAGGSGNEAEVGPRRGPAPIA